MGYYPVFLDITNRPAVVIGGGVVALRKVEGLLEAGARVTVVSPELAPPLAALRDEGRINHIGREYKHGDLAGFALAIVATDDGAVNAAVAQEARQIGVWVNAVDDLQNCDFIMPSVVRQGDLVIAISTGGGSPAVARKIREDLAANFVNDYALLLEVAAQVRQELRERGRNVSGEAWNAALDNGLRQLLAQGKRQEAKERLLAALVPAAARGEAVQDR